MPKSQRHRHIAEEESLGIIVYPDRRRMVGWIALSGLSALFFFLAIIGMIILMSVFSDVRAQGAAIFLTILFASFFVIGTSLAHMLV